MKQSVEQPATIGFFCPRTDQPLGDSVEIFVVKPEIADFENVNDIPDYTAGSSQWHRPPGLNEDYFRDSAEFLVPRNLTEELKLCIESCSSTTLKSPKLEIAIQHVGLMLFDDDSFPPSPRKNLFDGPMKTVFHKRPANALTAKTSAGVHLIKGDLEDIQPQRTVVTGPVFLGGRDIGELSLDCTLFADNLPVPLKASLQLKFTSSAVEMTLERWIKKNFSADRPSMRTCAEAQNEDCEQ